METGHDGRLTSGTIRVDLISSWGRTCGIASHSRMLCDALHKTRQPVAVAVGERWLDPAVYQQEGRTPDVLHLNYHLGLHSRWTPAVVAEVATRVPVVVTFHDTYADGHPRLWELLPLVAGAVIHEPVAHPVVGDAILGGKLHYWRQGVPDPPIDGQVHNTRVPLLGTIGFPFPWKNYDLLVAATREAGWGLEVISPTVPDGWDVDHAGGTIRLRDPLFDHVRLRLDATDGVAIEGLGACDATAFLYTCANSGTSGAIRFGLAVGKPLLANPDCRQFRDLLTDDGAVGITWTAPTYEAVVQTLRTLTLQRLAPGICYLRHRDSWRQLAPKYAGLYRHAKETRR